MDLNPIAVFAEVVRVESFTAAARKLGLPKSTVSRKISELEDYLGTQLLVRTTRKLSLTDAGRTYYLYADRIVAEAEAAEQAVAQLREIPRGKLRVTAPVGMGFLSTIVASFLKNYPEVQIELMCTDRVVDLVNEGFDLAIRAGVLADSSMVGRPLCQLSNHLVASPGFLKKQSTPKKPGDLAKLPCLAFGALRDPTAWKLTDGERTEEVRVQARFTVNDLDMLLDAVLEGHGIAQLPPYLSCNYLRQNKMIRVLPRWYSQPAPLSAVYPAARLVSPKVKAFSDHLKLSLSPPPWERGPKL